MLDGYRLFRTDKQSRQGWDVLHCNGRTGAYMELTVVNYMDKSLWVIIKGQTNIMDVIV